MSEPIGVVGGSLAGMATAARLAKAGHRVLLFEAGDRLGGRWAAPGVLPPVLTLPAPWRDLFRKSGRPFDAELARTGHALVPAPPAVHHFPDGSSLTLPTDRGQQWATLTEAWGVPAATTWRDLMDELDDRWQVLRPLGLEGEFTDDALTRARRKRLDLTRTVERVARAAPHPQAAALIRSTAWRIGSDPHRTPAFVAVRLALERTFGRWQLTRDARPVPAADLIELLTARLTLRGVDVRLGERVTALRPGSITTEEQQHRVAAVVSAVNPWEHLRLVDGQDPRLRRRTARTRPALAPLVTITGTDRAPAAIIETVQHASHGVRVEYELPGQLVSHECGAGQPDRGFGTRWMSPRTWLRMPPLRTAVPGIVSANASSRGGNDPWAQLLSGALATYVTHENLTGADIRPTNKRLKV